MRKVIKKSVFLVGLLFVISCSQGISPREANINNPLDFETECTPNLNMGYIGCSNEISNSLIATKSLTCNSTGDGYIYGNCELQTCLTDYHKSGNTCVANTCTPNQSYEAVDCKSDILNSKIASKTKTCNASGTDFIYGACIVTDCENGYQIHSNLCVAMECTPSESFPDVDCKSEIPYSTAATKTKTCNSTGTGFNYGECTLKSCLDYYIPKNNSCADCKVNGNTSCSSTTGTCPSGKFIKDIRFTQDHHGTNLVESTCCEIDFSCADELISYGQPYNGTSSYNPLAASCVSKWGLMTGSRLIQDRDGNNIPEVKCHEVAISDSHCSIINYINCSTQCTAKKFIRSWSRNDETLNMIKNCCEPVIRCTF